MNKMLSESGIVKAVAKQAIQRITRSVIADLQRMEYTLSGEDSELKTTWMKFACKSSMSSHLHGMSTMIL